MREEREGIYMHHNPLSPHNPPHTHIHTHTHTHTHAHARAYTAAYPALAPVAWTCQPFFFVCQNTDAYYRPILPDLTSSLPLFCSPQTLDREMVTSTCASSVHLEGAHARAVQHFTLKLFSVYYKLMEVV